MPLNNNLKSDQFDPVISIGVAASKLGISPETLRLYEREGLVLPFKTATGRRLYSHKDLEWIDCFRTQITQNGLNMAGIRLLLALIPCWSLKPCSEAEQADCPAYMNGEKVCWMVKDHGKKACDEDDCRLCKVYRSACKAGKLNEICLVVDD